MIDNLGQLFLSGSIIFIILAIVISAYIKKKLKERFDKKNGKM